MKINYCLLFSVAENGNKVGVTFLWFNVIAVNAEYYKCVKTNFISESIQK